MEKEQGKDQTKSGNRLIRTYTSSLLHAGQNTLHKSATRSTLQKLKPALKDTRSQFQNKTSLGEAAYYDKTIKTNFITCNFCSGASCSDDPNACLEQISKPNMITVHVQSVG